MDEYQLEQILDKLFLLTPLEKNNLYHHINDILKSKSSSPAASIVSYFEEVLASKREEIQEKSEEKSQGKVSPIFRRVC